MGDWFFDKRTMPLPLALWLKKRTHDARDSEVDGLHQGRLRRIVVPKGFVPGSLSNDLRPMHVFIHD